MDSLQYDFCLSFSTDAGEGAIILTGLPIYSVNPGAARLATTSYPMLAVGATVESFEITAATSCQHVVDYLTMHISQTPVGAAVAEGQFFVIESEQV